MRLRCTRCIGFEPVRAHQSCCAYQQNCYMLDTLCKTRLMHLGLMCVAKIAPCMHACGSRCLCAFRIPCTALLCTLDRPCLLIAIAPHGWRSAGPHGHNGFCGGAHWVPARTANDSGWQWRVGCFKTCANPAQIAIGGLPILLNRLGSFKKTAVFVSGFADVI